MGNYRTTVILKTDIVDSTPRLARQTQAEMSLQRRRHKQFISETASRQHGSIFQEEGDAYLIDFPSVTNACLAAMDMHQNLRSMQAGKGKKQRLAIRAVITIGDILYQESDTIGMAMSLTARMEKITPPDEIYLSQAAWLVLNRAEVQTSFVGEFNFKGFSEPEKVYKVDQKSGIRALTDQCIVIADAKGFRNLYASHDMEMVERFLLGYEDLMNDICEKNGGMIRQVNGDLFFMTFEKADQAISATKMLCLNWTIIWERYKVGMDVGIHKGNLNVFRSYVFGDDINVTERLLELGRFYKPESNRVFAAISGKVKDKTNIRSDDIKFQELDDEKVTQEIYKTIIREHRPYRLVVK